VSLYFLIRIAEMYAIMKIVCGISENAGVIRRHSHIRVYNQRYKPVLELITVTR
jgi:hypothetical protein